MGDAGILRWKITIMLDLFSFSNIHVSSHLENNQDLVDLFSFSNIHVLRLRHFQNLFIKFKSVGPKDIPCTKRPKICTLSRVSEAKILK